MKKELQAIKSKISTAYLDTNCNYIINLSGKLDKEMLIQYKRTSSQYLCRKVLIFVRQSAGKLVANCNWVWIRFQCGLHVKIVKTFLHFSIDGGAEFCRRETFSMLDSNQKTSISFSSTSGGCRIVKRPLKIYIHKQLVPRDVCYINFAVKHL